MAGKNTAAPVIIKRKKIINGGGHHGGAWKVAYADFVTAMMAFFLLMWLLGATTEKQRKGVADYFNPTITMSTTGSGSDVLGGDTSMQATTSVYSGTIEQKGQLPNDEMTQAQLHEAKADIDKALTAFGGESMTMERALRHVVTRVTDEGLTIEVFDLDDVPLFRADTAEAQPVLVDIATVVTEALAITRNSIAVNGHVRSYPVTLISNPVWSLSAARAETMRALLQQKGMPATRLRRVTGHADRVPVTADPQAIRNNRLEVVLLRRDR
ncbi:flagellar motor protein MotB [Gemmobacter serpentinus]|uniref:flagellar motor protein MotB n=1 Tax=Gemmobacter serpentinus TaxID=2652247 RepID=UPI00124D6A03|nr:flagellar motor protein MotB [Gemmobacter serpentinus]